MFKNSLSLFRKALFSTSTAENRIFFGNFPVGATEFTMRKFFDGCGGIEAIDFFKKDATGTSQGFGTVLFSDENALGNALKLNETLLQDKPVTIKKWEGEFKTFKAVKAHTKPRCPPSNSLYIGNVPFDVDGDELVNIFSEFGNVVSYRRPFDAVNQRPKGFGYVNFETTAEAQEALNKLNGHVLKGRPIRVDFAEPPK